MAKTNQDLREQLSYWEAEIERYDNLGDNHALERARRMYLSLEAELVERTQGNEPLDLS